MEECPLESLATWCLAIPDGLRHSAKKIWARKDWVHKVWGTLGLQPTGGGIADHALVIA